MGQGLINFNSQSVRFNLPQKTIVRQWLHASALKENHKIDSLSYIFCDDTYLLKINQEYLNHSTLTDIITFDLSEKQSKGIEGDIFISVERVKENARLFDIPFQTELKRVMIHGLLHLMGYKDKKTKDKAQMRKMEEAYLSLYNKLNK
jgi:probable rRNA maturation factor